MKAYIAQNDDGLVWLFSEKPVRVFVNKSVGYCWCVRNGCTMLMNNTMSSKREATTEGIQYTTWLEYLGFKKKRIDRRGHAIYEGISMKEPTVVEINAIL